jgi:hypothetical protein
MLALWSILISVGGPYSFLLKFGGQLFFQRSSVQVNLVYLFLCLFVLLPHVMFPSPVLSSLIGLIYLFLTTENKRNDSPKTTSSSFNE